MKKSATIIALAVIVWFAFSANAYAWLYYSKPAFCGRVIDAQMKTPIEGAVVVVIYYKYDFGLGAGGNSVPMKAKETLTDKKGEFFFPAYRAIINPIRGDSYVEFIIFKPGYKAIDDLNALPTKISDEKYFAIKRDMIGKEGEVKYVEGDTLYSYKGPLGLVPLERVITREERRKTRPSSGGLEKYQLPLFFKLLDDEYKYLYN